VSSFAVYVSVTVIGAPATARVSSATLRFVARVRSSSSTRSTTVPFADAVSVTSVQSVFPTF
jgi:hypothetical protein